MIDFPRHEQQKVSHVTMSCDQARELHDSAVNALLKIGELSIFEIATLDATAEIIGYSENDRTRIVHLPISLHEALTEASKQKTEAQDNIIPLNPLDNTNQPIVHVRPLSA